MNEGAVKVLTLAIVQKPHQHLCMTFLQLVPCWLVQPHIDLALQILDAKKVIKIVVYHIAQAKPCYEPLNGHRHMPRVPARESANIPSTNSR